jgi:hypothetical protein
MRVIGGFEQEVSVPVKLVSMRNLTGVKREVTGDCNIQVRTTSTHWGCSTQAICTIK